MAVVFPTADRLKNLQARRRSLGWLAGWRGRSAMRLLSKARGHSMGQSMWHLGCAGVCQAGRDQDAPHCQPAVEPDGRAGVCHARWGLRCTCCVQAVHKPGRSTQFVFYANNGVLYLAINVVQCMHCNAGLQVVSDFGIGPWKKAAEDFLATFEPAYFIREKRIGSPGGWPHSSQSTNWPCVKLYLDRSVKRRGKGHAAAAALGGALGVAVPAAGRRCSCWQPLGMLGPAASHLPESLMWPCLRRAGPRCYTRSAPVRLSPSRYPASYSLAPSLPRPLSHPPYPQAP